MTAKQDRRSQRTRHLLSAAFVELLREKGYSAITVSDIIERANVGRSTFYSHFHDKEASKRHPHSGAFSFSHKHSSQSSDENEGEPHEHHLN